MARHRLDLLPLLDVFMVVLFVFATIQEQRLDDSTKNEAELERRAQQAEATLRATRAGQAERDEAQRVEQARTERLRAAALTEVMGEAEHLREELRELREAFVAHRTKTREDLEAMGVPARALEHIEVLTKVLDKYSVFEIEVVGRVQEDTVTNVCCFRVDPLRDEWSSCGEVPPRAEDWADWLEGGAAGLVSALHRTKGGNAMTLVRQDHAATHRIASRLVEQLRDRFSDQHFYAEDAVVLGDHCR